MKILCLLALLGCAACTETDQTSASDNPVHKPEWSNAQEVIFQNQAVEAFEKEQLEVHRQEMQALGISEEARLPPVTPPDTE